MTGMGMGDIEMDVKVIAKNHGWATFLTSLAA
jgi:hypothetical protein